MNNEEHKNSKFLSYILRHNPDAIGIELDENGWVEIDELCRLAKSHNKHLTREIISEVVRNNDKKRFTLSDDKSKIRAAQGHSINIDLGLKPSAPPDMLYHGTASKNLNAIAQVGLLPMSRDMVHLSSEEETALKVGSRHGKPIIIRVDAAQMAQDGHEFFRAENGVWLAKQVEAKYLRF